MVVDDCFIEGFTSKIVIGKKSHLGDAMSKPIVQAAQ